MVPDQVWVVGRLVFRGRFDDGECTVLVATGRAGETGERQAVRLVGCAAERARELVEGDRVAFEARVVGARRALVAHRVHLEPRA